MNYGLNISASGALTAMHRQDVLANNLANLNTIAFKPETPMVRHRPAVREEDGVWHLPSNRLLERLGAGPLMAPSVTRHEQGSIETTSNPLDVAINGDGYLVVRSETSGSTDRLRLTRDGRLTLDGRGRLVMATTGMPVLDVQNRPIEVPPGGEVVIGSDGVIRRDGAEVATINLVTIADRSRLRKTGNNLFTAPSETINGAERSSGSIVQFSRERSAVDEIRALLDVQDAGRAASANLAMIGYQDKMTERAITQLGRIA
ncbi:MAG: flagellar hook basal-body protein [Phycisphaeraceae bacterium]|nr:flagellar hook basal-body protein [Phycisphaerae bacterium]MBX3392170.1 flagellar hook basal-body protein [Phycisphaeraceae bacterium]HRJ49715.1 flagellar hook basal-body protein [Phycisphaerales bacterium]